MEKRKTMDVREKLMALLSVVTCPNAICNFCEHYKNRCACERHKKEVIVDNLIIHGVTMQEWVSVNDRLPEESGEYLAYCGEYDGICVLYYEVSKTKSKWRTKWKEVTHWMPLPEPPNEV